MSSESNLKDILETETEAEEKPERKSFSEKHKQKKEKRLNKRRTRYERAISKDIRYRGPLSYRYFRVIAWIIICIFPLALVNSLRIKFDPALANNNLFDLKEWRGYQDFIIPLFLIANFAVILDKKDSFKNLIKRYIIMAAAVFASSSFFYLRYVRGASETIRQVLEIPTEVISQKIDDLGSKGYLSLNVFVDLLLCTLFMFFMTYMPKKYFTGKRLKYFRLLSVLPVAYEVCCIVLRILAYEGEIKIPILFYPLMTTKPPIMMLFFVLLVINIKHGERRFLRTGLDREQYALYQKTKTHSLHFSLHCCSLCIICSILDFIISIMLMLLLLLNKTDGNLDLIDNTLIQDCYKVLQSWGFFAYTKLMNMIIPFLLFSYSKCYKHQKVDVFMPFVAIAILMTMAWEGLYQVIKVVLTSGLDAFFAF